MQVVLLTLISQSLKPLKSHHMELRRELLTDYSPITAESVGRSRCSPSTHPTSHTPTVEIYKIILDSSVIRASHVPSRTIKGRPR